MKFWTFFFCGLSGSGKSTITQAIKKRYPQLVVLDGDVLRNGLCSDLRFSDKDRKENMRRLIELCKLFNKNGKHVLTSFIAPFEAERLKAKEQIENCKIIYCNASLETCEKRDVKGLYKKARKGEIKNFTGIDSDFDVSIKPDLLLDTENEDSILSINKFDAYMKAIMSSELLNDGKFLATDEELNKSILDIQNIQEDNFGKTKEIDKSIGFFKKLGVIFK